MGEGWCFHGCTERIFVKIVGMKQHIRFLLERSFKTLHRRIYVEGVSEM